MPEKKVTKPGIGSVESQFNWDRFVKDCVNNKYVLVIGNEAVLNKDKNQEANGDSSKLLFNLTTEELKEKGLTDNTATNFTQLSRNINNLRSTILETVQSYFKFEDNKEFEDRFEREFHEELDPALLDLLKTKCFRVVLTTTIDPYVEIAMRHIWGENGFRILNIYDIDKDMRPNEQGLDEFNELKPTLYYVFGKADINNKDNQFVLSENDAMSLISKWFSVERPKELLKYIQGVGMKIVSVGCKFDDWLFRFFWFILRGEINNLSNGQVAVEFNEEDRKLINYLQQENIKLFPDARSFMKEAASKIEDALKIGSLPRRSGGIFISYAHEDKYLALPLFHKLNEQGYKVWIDEQQLEPSAEYETRITNAINSCKIFMPILSTQVKNDLIEDKHRFYRDTEWLIAQSRYNDEKGIGDGVNKMKVLPVVIGEYQVRSAYHQKAEEFSILNVTAFEMAKESLGSLKQLINNLMKN
ncbi:MAG: toll/interleukin-1 receptor domain-containing protein [Prevotella sp.]|nr:toll/interleukin-1 receptor domain-containing protein [Prevotella sp.]